MIVHTDIFVDINPICMQYSNHSVCGWKFSLCFTHVLIMHACIVLVRWFSQSYYCMLSEWFYRTQMILKHVVYIRV